MASARSRVRRTVLERALTTADDRGANFLLYLERQVGGLDSFLPYARAYFKRFAGKSITTTDWRDHLLDWFKRNDPSKMDALEAVDWEVCQKTY